MQLIQILLPLYDNAGKEIPRKYYQTVKKALTRRFEGLTAYNRSPAEGLWKKGAETHRDDIIVYEVMTRERQTAWWRTFRHRLEKLFRQETVVIRCQEITLL